MLSLIGSAWAVQPDEVLDDPALEARARELSKDLRCLVCRNESIDESNADLARDLRVLLRERLVAGDSDTEAMEFIVDRFGEYVLLRPTTSGANWLLWAAGPGMLIMAMIMAGLYVRGRAAPSKSSDAGLTGAEQARLKELMDE
ncbi:cytochrome c-type biogenesis protein CcmH [Parasedimentitalea psychrophila]|uniref:Cytochrome c-type biogenesis protein n=2 Tax=Parasedimentitalea psychrophila TaxID=2997337 RepID=A0A9Y2P3H3_9RHOB|nr:cytochrome c-type biogenesis protein [Parasedimentitalea psychrophila]WIY27661.1 cytochrome c-type biogenesis protein CcmH [Parasedimentitalea psychrophila]